MKLAFRLIQDDSLTLTDRLVLSYAWKWAHWNYVRMKRGEAIRPIVAARFRKVLGGRLATINMSLTKQIEAGYLDADHKPLIFKEANGHYRFTRAKGKYMGHRIVTFFKDAPIRQQIYQAIAKQNYQSGKTATPMWYVKALGISRRTAFRWQKAANVKR